MEKICNKCKLSRSCENFYKHKLTKDGLMGHCKECHARVGKAKREANPEVYNAQKREYRKRNRGYYLKHKFGIEKRDFDEFMLLQNSTCAICLKPETVISKSGNVQPLSVDHDHETGLIRGLLCARCNKALGLLQDNPNLCENAAAYLRKYEKV